MLAYCRHRWSFSEFMGLVGLLNVLAHISLLRYCIARFPLVTYFLFESRQLLTCAVRGTVPMSKLDNEGRAREKLPPFDLETLEHPPRSLS